jgi:hypothetical protein
MQRTCFDDARIVDGLRSGLRGLSRGKADEADGTKATIHVVALRVKNGNFIAHRICLALGRGLTYRRFAEKTVL